MTKVVSVNFLKKISICRFAYIIERLFSRLYPVIPANARVITERDVQVGGYLLPKNVSVSKEKVHFETIHTLQRLFGFKFVLCQTTGNFCTGINMKVDLYSAAHV